MIGAAGLRELSGVKAVAAALVMSRREGVQMPLGTHVAAQLPYLRRYARALTGSQHTGDAFVRATLEAALSDEGL